MIKLQQYYVFKLLTSRLEEANYNIEDLTTSQARENGELIQIGDNQVFRTVRHMNGTDTNLKVLNSLIKERNDLKKLESSEENSINIKKLQSKIDDILFIPDIVNIKVDDKKVYKKIFKEGFSVNGIRFKRFCSGAGQSRQSTASFINEELLEEATRHLNCGLNIKKINVAKYNAYFGLYMSATYPVRTPRVCVIPDCEDYKIPHVVDWIDETEDELGNDTGRIVYEKHDFEFEANMWDGQGLISPSFAKEWQEDLKLDYLPAQFIVRSSFIKGAVVTFDIHEFAKTIAEKNMVTDIYGDEWDINEIDILLSASQFKMWKYYKSWEEVVQLQNHHGLTWGVSKVNPKKDNDTSLLNYQYIQTLDIDKDKIKELVQPTIDWVNKICSGDKLYSLLFLLGSNKENLSIEKLFDKTNNDYIKAVLYNDKLLKDPYILKKLYDGISNKIEQAKIGRVWANGNYQFMVSDPYGQAQFAFGMKVTGILQKGEYYSEFWNKRGVKKVDACRSPMVDFHEHNIIEFILNEHVTKWYKYQNSGIIYNVWGIDTIRHSDSDWDGDIVFTTDNEIIMNNIIPNLNAITYDKASAKEQTLNNTNILSTDLRSFDSKIGTITNYSTAFITMLSNFKKDTEEYNEILKRIKLLRRYIGDSIDQAKGIKTKPFPTEWKKRVFVNKEDSDEIKQQKYYHNKLVANKKPYFMIYIYEKLRAEYREHRRKSERMCKEKYGCGLNDLMSNKEKTKEESQFLYHYYRDMPVVKNNSVMNMLCRMFEEIDFNYKRSNNEENVDEMFEILFNKDIEVEETKLEKFIKLRNKFNRKRNFKFKNNAINSESEVDVSGEKNDFINEFYEEIRNEAHSISSNSQEIANYLVYIVYKLYPKESKDLAWHIGGEGIIKTLEEKSDMNIEIPMRDKNGVEYLGHNYSLRSVTV